MGGKLSSSKELLPNSTKATEIFPSQELMRECRNMGFGRDAVLRAWTGCKGDQDKVLGNLFLDCEIEAKYSKQQTVEQMKAQTLRLRKNLPKKNHLHLNFEGDLTPEFMKLRKLGLYSKRTFRNCQRLTLEYGSRSSFLQSRDIKILARNMNRGFRRLNHLTMKFDASGMGELTNMSPLCISFKQTFVNLVSLKLSFKWYWELSPRVLMSFDGLFARVSPTLKYLDLDFSENENEMNVKDFPERLGSIIETRLHKLESLCLDFTWTNFSTKLARFLINAAGRDLHHLKSLNLSFEGCQIVSEEKNFDVVKNNLQYLKLNFHYCSDLSMEYLDFLQEDIVLGCVSLKELDLSILNCERFYEDYYAGIEKSFSERLSLRKFTFLRPEKP